MWVADASVENTASLHNSAKGNSPQFIICQNTGKQHEQRGTVVTTRPMPTLSERYFILLLHGSYMVWCFYYFVQSLNIRAVVCSHVWEFSSELEQNTVWVQHGHGSSGQTGWCVLIMFKHTKLYNGKTLQCATNVHTNIPESSFFIFRAAALLSAFLCWYTGRVSQSKCCVSFSFCCVTVCLTGWPNPSLTRPV